MENKTSKYFKYAIGEIILVMIGILLALQVNNWNQKRLEHNEEKIILSNLKGDFQNAITEFKLLNALRNRIIDGAKSITKVSSKSIDQYSTRYLDSLFSLTLASPTFNNNSGSLNVLLSSGKINLISNDTLKKKLIEWPGDVEDMIEDEISQNDIYNGPYQQILSEYLSWNDLIKSYKTYQRVRFEVVNLEPMPDNPTSKSDYKALFNEKLFFNILHLRTVYCYITNQETMDLINKAESILKFIEDELKK